MSDEINFDTSDQNAFHLLISTILFSKIEVIYRLGKEQNNRFSFQYTLKKVIKNFIEKENIERKGKE